MAKLNGKRFHEIGRLFSTSSGMAYVLRSDGMILRRSLADFPWKPWKKFKPSVELTMERFEKAFKPGIMVPWYRGCQPTLETVMRWESDGISETIHCGCRVEPDGVCQHGRKSWCEQFL